MRKYFPRGTQLSVSSSFIIYSEHQQCIRYSSGQQKERCEQELCPRELMMVRIKMLPLLMQPYQQHTYSTSHSCPQQWKATVRSNATWERVHNKSTIMDGWMVEQTDRGAGRGADSQAKGSRLPDTKVVTWTLDGSRTKYPLVSGYG